MSYICLNKTRNWQQHNFIALGGLSDRALARFLMEHPNIKHIAFCLDNDFDARKKDGTPDENHGQIMAEQYRSKFAGKGFDASIITPKCKDWNDVIKCLNKI